MRLGVVERGVTEVERELTRVARRRASRTVAGEDVVSWTLDASACVVDESVVLPDGALSGSAAAVVVALTSFPLDAPGHELRIHVGAGKGWF